MPELATNLDLVKKICEHLPESAVWVQPVREDSSPYYEGPIIDFQFGYCNPASENEAGNSLLGKRILADKLPDPLACQLIFDQCLEVYTTGEPLSHSYFSTSLDSYFFLQRVKVMDGVLTTVRNRTEAYTTQIEKEKQARLLHSLIENSPYGIGLYESIRDNKGQIIDFKARLCNKKSADITGLSLEVLYTQTVKQLMALRGHSDYFAICASVVETGEPKYLEYYSPTRHQWIGFSIVKFEDGYLLNYIDITETKKYEQEAQHNAKELDAIFNGSISGVYTAKVLRNADGQVHDFVFLRANASFFSMFHLTPEAVIGKTLLSISGTDDQSLFIGFIQEVLETGKPAIQVLEYDSPKRWFEFSIVKLDIDTVAITVNDIASQKLAAYEIEKQKNLLDTIMRQSPNGLSITKAIRDEQGTMVDAQSVLMNNACERLNGVPNEVLLTHTMGELSPELLSAPVFIEATKLKTGEAFRTEYFLPLTKRWLELAIAKMDDDHFINVFTDISEIKNVQQELEQTIKELKRSNTNLEDFAHAASHDMKEPLRKIRTFADRIKITLGPRMTASESHMFDRIEAAAERMQFLVDDLLEFSQVNEKPKALEPVDLNDKVQKVLTDLELAIEEKEAQMISLPLPKVQGNPGQLQQLFYNLISNALKYSQPGVSPVITISARSIKGHEAPIHLPEEQREHTFHLIEVSDNGIGFEPQYAEQIFEMFQRLHGKAEYSGTGVGLAIVRKVVENHKGYIWAIGEPGKGATFCVLLPVA